MYVADAGERVKARAVGFPVASFEHVWYVKFFAYRGDCTGNVHCHLFSFDDARTCKKKKVI